MAKTSRTRVRRGGAQFDEREAIAALADELARERASARFEALLAEQDAARPRSELSPEAQRSVARFGRDTRALSRLLDAETAAMHARWGAVLQFDRALPPQRDLLHVYGPDRQGTGGPWFYRRGWTHIDDTQGAGIGAKTDHTTGQMWASHYTTGPGRNAYAGIGMYLRPRLGWCRISVRPYLPWSGVATLTHRVHDARLNERRWASALGQTGIIVQSWNPSGGAYNLDARHFVTEWLRQEINPRGARDYDGVSTVSTGLHVDVLGTDQRQYMIWVCLRVWVQADRGFATSTYAGSSISTTLPFVVVEEIPA
jgi:hypothetical protein